MKTKYSTFYAPFTAKEKWIGAMLDSNSGYSYYGGIKLIFSKEINVDKIKCSIISILAKARVLSAEMRIMNDKLMMCVPSELDIQKNIANQIDINDNFSDDEFVTQTISPFESGLRVRYRNIKNQHCFWIGFWVFLCDGLSIDLLIKSIVSHYNNGNILISNNLNIIKNINKRDKENRFSLSQIATNNLSIINKKNNEYQTYFDDVAILAQRFNIQKDKLEFLSRKFNLTIFALIFSIFQISVSDVYNLEKIITEIPFANRFSSEEFVAIGPFSNTVPVITKYLSSCKLMDKIFETQKSLLDASTRQMVNNRYLLIDSLENYHRQIFNSWNSQLENETLLLNDGNSVSIELIHNKTIRADLDVTIGFDKDNFLVGRLGFRSENANNIKNIIDSMNHKFDILLKGDL